MFSLFLRRFVIINLLFTHLRGRGCTLCTKWKDDRVEWRNIDCKGERNAKLISKRIMCANVCKCESNVPLFFLPFWNCALFCQFDDKLCFLFLYTYYVSININAISSTHSVLRSVINPIFAHFLLLFLSLIIAVF